MCGDGREPQTKPRPVSSMLNPGYAQNPQRHRHLARRSKTGGWGRILPLSDRWSLANVVRKVEFKLLRISSSRRDPILASQCAKTTFGKVLLRSEPR